MISILTPTLNRANSLEATIQSVYAQGIEDLEYIIMDGGSTDGTRELVARYPQIRFYSEPDKGLYDALNKCMRLANGKYWAWVNSDDYFTEGVLKRMLEQIKKTPSMMALFASAEISPSKRGEKAVLVPAISEGTLMERVTLGSFSFNAGVFNRKVFEILGGFDIRYKIGADREFLFRFGLNRLTYQHIDDVAYVYQSFPGSLTYGKQIESRVQANLEEMQMAKAYLSEQPPLCADPNLCRRWYTRSSSDAAVQLLLNGKLARAIQITREGSSIDKGWFGSFFKLLFLAISRLIFSQGIRAKFSRLRHVFTDIK